MYFSPQPAAYFQNHAHNEEAEGRLRVSLVSPSGYFAHEGLGT